MPTVEEVLYALRYVLDPEIGINVVDLGLLYGLEIHDGDVKVELSMTTPTCPLSEYLVDAAERAIARYVPTATTITVDVVLEPAWAPEMISDYARRMLGWTV